MESITNLYRIKGMSKSLIVTYPLLRGPVNGRERLTFFLINAYNYHKHIRKWK